MSFGFGVGDLIAVGTLAWKVYKNVYKASNDAPDSFQKVHQDVLSLHAVLKETSEIVFDPPLSMQRQQRLQTIADGCTSVLSDLQALVIKYEGMGTQGKMTWKRLRWGSEDIVEYRLRITSSVAMLNAFMNTSQAVTQQKLEKYLREVQFGRREGSIMSVQTVDSLSMEDRAAWRAIRKDLESIGITPEAYQANQEFIQGWLTRPLDTGALDKQVIPTEEDEAIQLESPASSCSSSLSESGKTLRPDLEDESSSVVNSQRIGVPEVAGTLHTDVPKPSPSVDRSCIVAGLARTENLYTTAETSSGRQSQQFKLPRPRGKDHMSKLTVQDQSVSRVATLIAIVSRPKARLLTAAKDPGLHGDSIITRIMGNPATSRLIDARTIEEAFLTACYLGSSDSVSQFLNAGQRVNAITDLQTYVITEERSPHGRKLEVIIPQGASALMLAALKGKQETMELLLRGGAEVNFKSKYPLFEGQKDTVLLPTPLEQTSEKVQLKAAPFFTQLALSTKL
ncbi:MAG: hypothetical protein Q9169_008119 [Polycauliona sp. 2 TL-2023]